MMAKRETIERLAQLQEQLKVWGGFIELALNERSQLYILFSKIVGRPRLAYLFFNQERALHYVQRAKELSPDLLYVHVWGDLDAIYALTWADILLVAHQTGSTWQDSQTWLSGNDYTDTTVSAKTLSALNPYSLRSKQDFLKLLTAPPSS